MSYILKREPAWLESLPIDSTGDALADLIGDSGHVSVPATLLLAVSPLLRSMVTDPVCSPLVIILPGVRAGVLQVVLELLLKGTSDVNEDRQMKARKVFDILSIGASFSLKDEIDRNVVNEDAEGLEFDYLDSFLKFEMDVKLEQEECNSIFVEGDGVDKQPAAGNVDSFIEDSLKDLESQVGQSQSIWKEVAAHGGNTVRQNMLNQRKNIQVEHVKVFNCQKCEYQSRRKSHLKQHLRRHTGDKPFKCCLCEYKTGDKSDLRKHQRIHSGDKPFNCDICEYKTGNKELLRRHQRIHSGVKPFNCYKCEYKTGNKPDLKKHQRIHSGVKPFNCDKCEYITGNKSDLRKHQRIHSGFKPFNCDKCEYKTGNKSDLRKHQRIHSGDKPFNCDGCEFKARNKSDLTKHQRIHSGDKPFNCDKCEYKTSYNSHLKRHQRTHSV